jgi:hypothetical protein
MPLDEQRLRDLLIHAADDARPVVGVVAAASRRGRRLRHRRQILFGTATALAIGTAAVGAFVVTGPRHPGPVQATGPDPGPGQPLTAAMRPVGRVQSLWQGQRNGQPTTVAAWFTAEDFLCLGEPVAGGYRDVSCSGSLSAFPHARVFTGWGGTAAGVPNLDDGAHTWYVLPVERTAARVTVTLTTGAVLPATLYLADGPQAHILAVALAPPHSIARQFTAYDASGHQIDTANP